MDWTRQQTAIMEWARRKGWEDDPCDIPESVALIVSELSEALEEHRKGKRPDEVYYLRPWGSLVEEVLSPNTDDDGNLLKPEGIPAEIADTLIRVLHLCERHGWVWEQFAQRAQVLDAAADEVWGSDLTTDLALMGWAAHMSLNFWLVARNIQGADWGHSMAFWMARLIWMLEDFAARHGFNLASEVERKMAYNETRPYRHGGKLA